ncbi:hypothetical protein ACFVQB_29300 [Paenibacillus sp. NPDC057886]|uniref:hypothetical protein n=1 Tax=Paenibacillus sp. NPDC057886 TaxID=3346270 RepID=UPI0036CBC438
MDKLQSQVFCINQKSFQVDEAECLTKNIDKEWGYPHSLSMFLQVWKRDQNAAKTG